MVCEELDQLEWDFIQARAGSLDLDSLGWTDREFSCLEAILDHKRGASGRSLPSGTKYYSEKKARCQSGPEGLAAFSSFHLPGLEQEAVASHVFWGQTGGYTGRPPSLPLPACTDLVSFMHVFYK